MRNMRHVVDILRPTEHVNGRGQSKNYKVLRPNVPCSIEDVGSGRNYEQARKVYADATLVVEMYGKPDEPLETTDVLQFGKRKLNIGHIADEQQNGIKLKLYCGEAR